MIDLLSLQKKAEKATPGVHEARYVKSQMPVDCVKYGVISKHTGYETCRVWTREDVEFYAAASPETILSLCSELSAARESKWISVEREMPGYMEEVLVRTDEDEVRKAHLEREDHGDSAAKTELDFWYSSNADQEIYHVTHWMKLPEAPK